MLVQCLFWNGKVRKQRGSCSIIKFQVLICMVLKNGRKKGDSLTPVLGPLEFLSSLERWGGRWGCQIMCFKSSFVLYRQVKWQGRSSCISISVPPFYDPRKSEETWWGHFLTFLTFFIHEEARRQGGSNISVPHPNFLWPMGMFWHAGWYHQQKLYNLS